MITFREGERTLAAYHRHPVILLFALAPSGFFLCIVIAIAIVAMVLIGDAFAALRPLVMLAALFFANLFWIALFVILTDFYLDVWIVTNKRVISVEQKGFFSRTISEFELSKIQDVTVDVRGIIPTLLHYGDLVVRTASEDESFVFKQVQNPTAIKDDLMKAAIAQQSGEDIKNITMQSPV